jgi:hypothetical protein
MTSTTERHSAAASQSASTAEKMADFWTQGAQRLSEYMIPGLPQVDLIPAIELYFEFVQQTVDISRDLTLKWAEAAGMLSGAVREQGESVGGLVREQAESARHFAHEQAGKAERAAREQAGQAAREQARQAEKAEKAEKELARKAGREQAGTPSSRRAGNGPVVSKP